MSNRSFSQLALPPAQLSNLGNLGYLEMTEIQAAALPPALAGLDVVGQAKTGSGKTAAFGLPLLVRLNPQDFAVQALVLCPTRELAAQVAGEIRRLARYQDNIKVVVLCGGQAIGPQLASLEHGAHVVVGTPGRIRDHLRKGSLVLQRVRTLVLDEADRMLDMGFIEDIESIIAATPADRQTLLYSATFPGDVHSLSSRFQRGAQHVSVQVLHGEQRITQRCFVCEKPHLPDALVRLLAHFQPTAAVVFCNTKQAVHEVCAHLQRSGIDALALHGDMEQRERDQVLIQLRHRSCNVLVATDVAARGLDIDDLPVVVNYELPPQPQVYVHRIGRTGRAGNEGLALSLFADSQRHRLQAIGHYQQRALDIEVVDELPLAGGGIPQPPFVTLCIAGGRKDKLRPGDILGALTGEAGVDAAAVGKITVAEYASYVAIARELAHRALGRLRNGRIKGRTFRVRILQGSSAE